MKDLRKHFVGAALKEEEEEEEGEEEGEEFEIDGKHFLSLLIVRKTWTSLLTGVFVVGILAQREHKDGGYLEYLVKWTDYPFSESRWQT